MWQDCKEKRLNNEGKYLIIIVVVEGKCEVYGNIYVCNLCTQFIFS